MAAVRVQLVDPAEILSSSRRWMTVGLAAFSRNDGSEDFAVHHVGVAMEHLLKAYLASLHPAHIVEDKNWESLLHATGHADRSRISRSRTKTIGLSVAFDRVRRLIPTVTVSTQEFEPVLAARNGVAHVGDHDQDEVRAVLTTVIRLAIPVLAEIEQLHGVDDWAEDYWGLPPASRRPPRRAHDRATARAHCQDRPREGQVPRSAGRDRGRAAGGLDRSY